MSKSGKIRTAIVCVLSCLMIAPASYLVSNNSNCQGVAPDTSTSTSIEEGAKVKSIEKTNTEGLVDTYTITFTDGTQTTFTVTNGAQGEQGIQGIQGAPGEDGHTPVITIVDGYWYVDGETTNVRAEGVQGATGNGISAIEKTSSEGLIDTYTITYTNGDTTTFTVVNGKDGLTWFTSNGIPTEFSGQKVGDYCLDVLTSDVYQFDGSEWSKIANIKGISVDNIQVEYFYDNEGKLFQRYTFTLTDGSVRVKDVYDPNQVYKIIAENYIIPKEELPTSIPELYFTVIYNNSTRERVRLTKEMIVNIQEVHFSVVGEWEVMVNYYGCIEFLYVTCYDPNEKNVTSDSYLNYDTIIWTQQNRGMLGGITYTVVYDNPNLQNDLIYLATDQDIEVLSIYNGNRLAAIYETYYESWDILHAFPKERIAYSYQYRITEDGMLEYTYSAASGWKPVSGIVYGESEIWFSYKGYSFKLNVNNVDNASLQNAEVVKFEYVGDTIYWKDEANPDVIADKSAVNFTKYGYLLFYIKTPTMEGPYFRNIDVNEDIFYRMDTGADQQLIVFEPTQSDVGPLQCEIHATIQPGVTNRRYVADNAVPIVVSGGNVVASSVALNKTAMLTTDSIKDLTVSFYINEYPYVITVPLTTDMLVDGESVFAYDSVTDINTYQREVRLQYQYYDSLLTGSTYITIIDASKYPASTANGIVRYSGVSPVESKMKTTKDSATIPEIQVTISFRVKEDTGTITYNSINLHKISLTLTKDMITNLNALDFSREGDKVIRFVYAGVERSVEITFYDVYKSPIESISHIKSEMEIDVGDDLMEALIAYYCPEGNEQKWTIRYKEEYNGVMSEDIVVTPELVRACFDLSNFDSSIAGMHSVLFRYVPIEGGAYETYISVIVKFDATMGELYTVKNGTLGNLEASEASIDVSGQTIAWVSDSEEGAAYYTVVEETDGYIIANLRSVNTDISIFENINQLVPSLMPGTWEEILESGDCLIFIDKQAKTVENYLTQNEEALYTMADPCGIFEGANVFATFTGKIINLYAQEIAVEGETENTNPLVLIGSYAVQYSNDGRAVTPTLSTEQVVPILHGIFAENGEKTITLMLGGYGEEYAIVNAVDMGLEGTNPTVVLTEYGLYYRIDEMTVDNFNTTFGGGYIPYHYTVRNGEKVLVVDIDGEDIYATIDEETRSMTVYVVPPQEILSLQIDWSAIVNYRQSMALEGYTYYADGCMSLYQNYGMLDFRMWYTQETVDDNGNSVMYTYTDTNVSDEKFEYVWFDGNMLCFKLENSVWMLEDIYFEYDAETDTYIAKYVNEYMQAIYDVDFFAYSGVPEGYKITGAQLVLMPDYKAELRLQGNIDGLSEVVISNMDLIIIESCNILVCRLDTVSFMFTYSSLEIDDSGRGATVKMVEVVEGEGWDVYDVDCSRFIQVLSAMSGGISVEVLDAKMSLNYDLMMGTLYFHVNVEGEGEMMQSLAFSFLEFNGRIFIREDLFGEIPVYFEPSKTNSDVYMMNIDLSSVGFTDIETIYYYEEFGQIIICANGYAWTEKAMDNLTNSNLAPYVRLNDDLIFIHTVLGVGMVFEINEDNTLTLINEALYDENEFEIEKFMLGDMSCAIFISKTTGEGVLSLNQEVEGEMVLLPLYQEEENLYKSCILTVALIIERIDEGVFVMRSPQSGFSL